MIKILLVSLGRRRVGLLSTRDLAFIFFRLSPIRRFGDFGQNGLRGVDDPLNSPPHITSLLI